MTERLFVYGSLAPGEANAHVLTAIDGTWEPATVTGTLHPEGWGATLGFPALIPDEHGGTVEGLLFTAPGLADHWPRLDAFEGSAYERITVQARTRSGAIVPAFVYALKQDDSG